MNDDGGQVDNNYANRYQGSTGTAMFNNNLSRKDTSPNGRWYNTIINGKKWNKIYRCLIDNSIKQQSIEFNNLIDSFISYSY